MSAPPLFGESVPRPNVRKKFRVRMADRKARLQALKLAAERKGTQETGGSESGEVKQDGPKSSNPTLKFRNYEVRDSKIAHEKVEASRAKVEDAPALDVERALGRDVSEVIANVAPKKSNFDLRKEIAGKLAKLDRRTQRAIAELAVEEEKKRLAEA